MKARRVAHKHPLQHLLNDPKPSRVADEVRSKLPRARRSKRHVIAEDIMLITVFVFDGGERFVGLLLAGLRIVELNVI
jgi:hypothetical protein